MLLADPAPVPLIESRIYLIRGQKVLLDADLASLYEVETKALNQAVRRNKGRFPDDFLFHLTPEETAILNLRSQIVTSSSQGGQKGHGGRRYQPYAFTEQGVAMLSSVLSSKRAIEVNIAIMRTFVRLRHLLAAHEEIARRLEQLEWRQSEHGSQIEQVFGVIQRLIEGPAPAEDEPRRKFGFSAASMPHLSEAFRDSLT